MSKNQAPLRSPSDLVLLMDAVRRANKWTVKQFCANVGISYATYYYWRACKVTEPRPSAQQQKFWRDYGALAQAPNTLHARGFDGIRDTFEALFPDMTAEQTVRLQLTTTYQLASCVRSWLQQEGLCFDVAHHAVGPTDDNVHATCYVLLEGCDLAIRPGIIPDGNNTHIWGIKCRAEHKGFLGVPVLPELLEGARYEMQGPLTLATVACMLARLRAPKTIERAAAANPLGVAEDLQTAIKRARV